MIALSMPVDNLDVVQSLVDYVSSICKTVGQRVTDDKVCDLCDKYPLLLNT